MARRISFRIPALALLALLLMPLSAASQDTELFSTTVAPNVVLVVDNSGSMHEVVWHPEFDPDEDPTAGPDGCQVVSNDHTQFVGSSFTFNPSDFDPDCVDDDRLLFVDERVDDKGEDTRWNGRYINWYSSHAATPYISEITDPDNGSWSACVAAVTSDDPSPLYRRSRVSAAQDVLREVICQVNAVGSVRFGLAQYRNVASGFDPHGGYIRVPAEDYLDGAGDPNEYELEGVTQSHGDHLNDAIEDLTGESNTPLAETLFQIYTYFQSRSFSDRPDGADGSTRFPRYQYSTCHTCDAGGPRVSSGDEPPDPVQYACQKNFVVLITDGEPTQDDFDTDGDDTDQGFGDIDELIGDLTGDGNSNRLDDIAQFMQNNDFRPDIPAYEGDEQVIDVYTVGFTTNATANALLQSTADEGNGRFYFSNDPDALATSIIDTIREILEKSQSFTAATVPAVRTSAGGQFYNTVFIPSSANGYWEGHLRSWTITGSGEILDSNGVCALDDGDPTDCTSGAFKPVCSVSPGPGCVVPHWDAGEETTQASPGGRTLYTSKLSGTPAEPTKVVFDTANMTQADLGISAADIGSYTYAPHPAPTTGDELRDALVWNVRGCELGSTDAGCTKRPWLLGDIFHSDPVVVGPPSSFETQPDFAQFRQNFATRDRVIAAGANDGFLRLFDAGTWDSGATPPAYDVGTGDEVAGFAPYESRQNLRKLPLKTNARTQYFVDGAPSVADTWLWESALAAAPKDGTGAARWRTVLVGGMREGGDQYFALDITDPDSGCPAGLHASGDTTYPCYMWEFPREDAASTVTDYMGQTWGDPIIVKIRVKYGSNDNGGIGYERYVAVVSGGYDPTGDPNAPGTYEPDATAGRSLYVIDVKTGQVLKEKKFVVGSTTSSTDPSSVAYDPANPEQSMHFALTSTPAVYDLNFDGFADVIYAPDLGGNVWKWVIKDIADLGGQVDLSLNDSDDWDGQAGNDFRLFFQAPDMAPGAQRHWKSFFHAPSATFSNGDLWLAFGSGERQALLFQGVDGDEDDNNRLYSVKDLDPLEQWTTPQPVLLEQTTGRVTISSSPADQLVRLNDSDVSVNASNRRGFYIVGDDDEKFNSQSDISSFAVIQTSFTPAASTDPCNLGGSGKLYAFRIDSGVGIFTDDSTGDPVRALDLGVGVPTDPQVSTGPSNRIIVSSDDIDNREDEREIPDAGMFYWRELSE